MNKCKIYFNTCTKQNKEVWKVMIDVYLGVKSVGRGVGGNSYLLYSYRILLKSFRICNKFHYGFEFC